MQNANLTLYETLNISPGASLKEIQDAYAKLKNTFRRSHIALYSIMSSKEQEEVLKKVEEAYLILSHPEYRKHYDDTLKDHLKSPNKLDSSAEYGLLQEGSCLETNFFEDAKPLENVISCPHPVESLKIHEPESAQVEWKKGLSMSLQRNFGSHSIVLAPAVLSSELLSAIEVETEWRGAFLKRIRNAYQISIEEMSEMTKVTKHYLTFIEEENYEKLPARVYIRGFVLQIAKILKLPAEKVASAYLSRYSKP